MTVADGSGLSSTLPVTVTVNDLNETPLVSGNNSPDVPEIEFDVDGASLTTANLTVPGTYTFSDEDDGDDDVTWGLSGADAEPLHHHEERQRKWRPDLQEPKPRHEPQACRL